MREANSQGLKIAVLATVLVLFSIASTNAQTEKVTLEVGVEAGPSIITDTEFGYLYFVGEPHLSYFLTGRIAVGVTGFFFDLDEIRFGAAYGHINYFFSSSSRLAPYFGVRLGVSEPISETPFGLGPQIGLKYFVSPHFSVNVQLDGAIHRASEFRLFLSSLALGLSYYVE